MEHLENDERPPAGRGEAIRWALLAGLAALAGSFLGGDAAWAPPAGPDRWRAAAALAVLAGIARGLWGAGAVGRVAGLAVGLGGAGALLLLLGGGPRDVAPPPVRDAVGSGVAAGGLLLTYERGPAGAESPGREEWCVADAAFAASTSRDAALASVLSGLAPPAHGCRVDGDAPESAYRSLAATLVRAGFEARSYGVERLPAWAARADRRADGGLAEAVAWLAEPGGSRFAHVHVETLDPDALGRAAARLSGCALVVTSLAPTAEPDHGARFLGADAGRVALAWRAPRAAPGRAAGRPRSQLEVAPSLLVWLGVQIGESPPAASPIPRLDVEFAPSDLEGPRGVVVVFEHRADGRPHLVRARTPGGTLAVEATPLGRHPTADWALTGPTQEHAAYRNALRVEPPTASADDLVRRLAEWMDAIGAPRDGS
ncbi:MAG: hypothetical protein AAGB93_20875 [Planctomycetota bacterium]